MFSEGRDGKLSLKGSVFRGISNVAVIFRRFVRNAVVLKTWEQDEWPKINFDCTITTMMCINLLSGFEICLHAIAIFLVQSSNGLRWLELHRGTCSTV